MAPNIQQAAAITCAESIAILHLLHSVPEQPSSNPVIGHQSRRTGHTLSFDEERSLASTLAFLARTTDNPNYIPAVCIEERPEPVARLNVLLAVNKARPEDGKQVLARLKKGFSRIFALLSLTNDDPNLKGNLINTLEKVSRYRETATFLCSTARRFILARKMQIVTVELPEKAFDRVPTDQYTPRFQQTMAANHAPGQLGDICRLLGVSEKEAQKLFAQQSRKTLKEAKIHAEIQLIHYCELHSSSMALWPRVIRSSKDACDNESTLSILLWEASTSAVSTEEPTPITSSKDTAAPEHIGSDESDATGNAVTGAGGNTPTILYNEPTVRDVAIIDETKDEVDVNHATSLARSRGPGDSEESPEFIPGTVVSKSIAVCEASQLYAAGRVELQVDYGTRLERQVANGCHRRLKYDVGWLTREEAMSLENSEAVSVWDVESLEAEVSCCTGGPSDMYISACGAMLRALGSLRQKVRLLCRKQ
ncbi:hypothetical protein DL770_004310 [Monosporascus sp. CRB-9-2]|nr:hypothetical protein DL770_004310 [Monosporascus sp. CRB-9-2]